MSVISCTLIWWTLFDFLQNHCFWLQRESCYETNFKVKILFWFLLFVSGNHKFPLCCKLKNTFPLFFHPLQQTSMKMLHNYDNNKVTSHLRIGRTIKISERKLKILLQHLRRGETKNTFDWVCVRWTLETFAIFFIVGKS